VGRNGSGKSTLFRLILGDMEPDEGTIGCPKGYKIGTLPQHIHFTKDTLLDEGCTALPPDEEYDAYKIERILSGLGFSEEDFQKPPSQFSGGFQIRINLTKTLVQKPDLLLLDEPTNYLDIVSQRWLADYLNTYRGEIILITHDREFMDQTTNHVMGIHRSKLRKYKGDTNNYYGKIIEEEEHFEKQRLNQESQKKHLEKYINRFRASARRASQAQSRIKKLAKFENMETLSQLNNLKLNFNYAHCPSKTLMTVKDLSFAFEPTLPLINNLSFSIGAHDRVGFIGKNGKGKSTLLNLLGEQLKPVQGEIVSHPSMVVGHFGQTNINKLSNNRTVEQEIESVNPALGKTIVRSICGTMMFNQDLALKEISVLSGGERSRVLLGKILANATNLLLLDEPSNHLDQEAIEGLIEGIDAFKGAVVIITHSEMLLRRLVNKLVVFHRNRVEYVNGDYDYFLNKYGWDDEGSEMTETDSPISEISDKTKVPTLSRKEMKKNRGELVQQRSTALKPLKTEMDELEREICSLELRIKESNQTLVVASQTKNVTAFVALSKQIKANQKIIDKNFARLETITLRHDKIEKEFSVKIAD